jgi:hypothetical protein
MLYDRNISFLREKINALRTAILNDLNSFSQYYIYPCLIHAEDVDQKGHVWFSMDSRKYDVALFEKPVPVRLQFFSSGKNFRLDITGMASLPTEKDRITHKDDNRALKPTEDTFPVKVKIFYAEYADVKTPQSTTNVFSMLYYKWLNGNQPTQMLVLR